jgi:hypothetical protein
MISLECYTKSFCDRFVMRLLRKDFFLQRRHLRLKTARITSRRVNDRCCNQCEENATTFNDPNTAGSNAFCRGVSHVMYIIALYSTRTLPFILY